MTNFFSHGALRGPLKFDEVPCTIYLLKYVDICTYSQICKVKIGLIAPSPTQYGNQSITILKGGQIFPFEFIASGEHYVWCN